MAFPQLPFCALRTRRIGRASSSLDLALLSSQSGIDLVRPASSVFSLPITSSNLTASDLKQAFSTLGVASLTSEAVASEVKQLSSCIPISLISGQASLNIVVPDLDADLAIYKDKYNAAGSTFATGEQAALSTFIATLKTAGIWSKIGFLWVCPASPSNIASGAIYLKPYASTNAMTLNNFVLGDFSINGLIGNGSTKYADTNILSSDLFNTTNMGLGVCSHTSGSVFQFEVGAYGTPAGFAYIALLTKFSDNNTYWISGNDTGAVITDNTTNGQGLYFGNLSGTTATIYKDKTTLVSGSSTGTKNPINVNLYAWGGNFNGTLNYPSNRRLSLIIATNKTALSTTERDSLYDAYSDYCSSIGRTL